MGKFVKGIRVYQKNVMRFIFSGIVIAILYSISVHAGGEGESEEEIAARNVWHAAKLRGVAFRAIGQEPGWLLEMTTGEKILLVTNYGRTKTEYPYVEPEVYQNQRKSVFVVSQDKFKLTIEGISCTDSMSGENDGFEILGLQSLSW